MTTSGDTNLHRTGSSAAGKSMPASSAETGNIVAIAITVIAPSELIQGVRDAACAQTLTETRP